MFDNSFKPGDEVICVESSLYKNISENVSYIISCVDDIYVSLVGDDTGYQYLYTRFRLNIKAIRLEKLKKLKR